MLKRVAIVSVFIVLFLSALWFSYQLMQPKSTITEQEIAGRADILLEKNDAEEIYRYKADDLEAGCRLDDGILCAIERTVKCTMAPDLDGCDKNYVPAFVLAKSDDTARPSEMSFQVKKIKPIAESTDIAVYTESDCDAMWFGLCKGTVVYSLSLRENETWAVTNIYALE